MTPEEHYRAEEFIDAFERVFCARVEWKGECWQWLGQTASDPPYGQITVNRKKMQAHRFSYEFFCGPIQARYHIHHKCENTLCVNPQHLEQLPPAKHVSFHIRAAEARRWLALVGSTGYGNISDREVEVLSYVGEGYASKDIASVLGLSIKTVEFHKTNIRKKLNWH